MGMAARLQSQQVRHHEVVVFCSWVCTLGAGILHLLPQAPQALGKLLGAPVDVHCCLLKPWQRLHPWQIVYTLADPPCQASLRQYVTALLRAP